MPDHPLPAAPLSLIWAQARNRVIGNQGGMPWHLPEDMTRFTVLTTGSTVIMGRRTWDSIPPRFRPLPNRFNRVVSRDPRFVAPGAQVHHTIEDALEHLRAPAWIIGGSNLYELTIPLADRIHVTEIDQYFPGDTYAARIGPEWTANTGPWQRSSNNVYFRFVEYQQVLQRMRSGTRSQETSGPVDTLLSAVS